jgi:uncharacterized phage protein (TIGR01671 family)
MKTREIKFRGFWKTVKGEWQFAIGNLSIVDNKERSGYFISNKYGSPFAYQVRPETVGQFTGLKDRNGKDLFVGDILELKFILRAEVIEFVDKQHCMSGFMLQSISKNKIRYGFETFDGSWLEQAEVIGNIYENPELLK